MTNKAVFQIDADITAIEAKIKKLGQLGAQAGNAAAAPIASSGGADAAIASQTKELARLQGFYQRIIQLQQESGALTKAQAKALRDQLAAQTGLGVIPQGKGQFAAGTVAGYAKTVGLPEAQARQIIAESGQGGKIASRTANNPESLARAEQRLVAKVQAQEVAVEKTTQEEKAKETAKRKTLTAEERTAKAAERAAAEAEGRAQAKNARLAALADPATPEAQRAVVDAQNKAVARAAEQRAREAAAQQEQYAYNKSLLSNNRAGLQAAAQEEARFRAQEREVAVAYDRAIREQLLIQVRSNEQFRQDIAKSDAYREARIAIERELVAKELARVQPDGTRLRDDIVRSRVTTDTETAVQEAAIAEGRSANREYVDAKRRAAIVAQNEAAALTADLTEARAANDEYVVNKVRTAKAAAVEAGLVDSALAADGEYVTATRAAAEAKLRRTAQEQIASAAAAQSVAAETAQAAVQTKIAQETVALATAEGKLSQEYLTVKAQRIVAEKRAAQALNEQLAREIALQGGSRFEQAQARQGHYAGNGNPTTSSGLFASGLITTVKYAVPSAALFGAYSGLKDSIQAAQELQVTFAKLEAQAESLNTAGDLPELKQGLLDVATATGVATTEVADLGFQFQGAFGGDTQRTLEETQSAAEAVKITGLSLKETTDAFTAIATSYDDQGVSIRNITDDALALQERFGVLAKETISFTADIAPLGQQIGLTTKELETLGAVANKYSGRSGSALAEAFGRVFPSIQEKANEIIALFNEVGDPALAKRITNNLTQGLTGPAFFDIAKSFNTLNQSQQNQLLELLGGRRESQSIIGVLKNAGELSTEFDSAGKSAEYMSKVSETLSNRVERLKQQLLQLGIALFEGGLGDALGDIISAFAQLASLVGAITGVFLRVNEVLGGLPVKILTVAAAVKLLTAAFSVGGNTLQTFTGRLGLFGAQAATTVPYTAAATNSAAAVGNLYAAPSNSIGSKLVGNSVFKGGGFKPAAGQGGVVALLAAVGVQQVLDKYQSTKADVSQAQKSLEEKMLNATDAELEKIAETNTDLFSQVSIRFFGQTLPEEIARKTLTKRKADAARPVISALINNDALGKQFFEGISDPNLENLNQFFSQNASTADTFKKFDLGTREYRGVENGQLRYDTTVDRNKLREALPKLQEAADNNDAQAAEALRYITEVLETQNSLFALKAKLDKLVAEGKVQEAIDAAGGASNFASANVEVAGRQRSAGVISTSQYVDVLRQNIETLKQTIAANPGNAQENIIALGELQNELDSVAGDRAKAAVALSEKLLSITGQAPENIAATINAAIAGQFGELSQTDRFAFADQALEILQKQLDEEVASIDDPLEAVRRAKEGLKIPEELRQILVEQQVVQDPNFDQFVQDISTYTGFAADQVAQQVAQIILETDVSTKEALLQLIRTKIDQLTEALGALAVVGTGGTSVEGIQNAIAELRGIEKQLQGAADGPGVSAPDRITTDGKTTEDLAKKAADDAKKQAEDARKNAIAARRAYFDYLRVLADGDAVRLAQIDAQAAAFDLSVAETEAERIQAQAAAARAQQAARDAEIEKGNAAFDYFAAVVSGDAVRSAQVAEAKANYAIQNARSEADRLNALAQKVQADRALQNAIFAIYEAQSNFLQAQAEYVGDTVNAAELALAEANRKLQQVQFQYEQGGAGQADLIAAKADLIRATAAARDARISKLEDDYAFQYEMGQITRSQYIQYLEGLKSLADGNTQIIRDLDRKIKQLKGELGADNQFNLPANIALPTLYESRRINQSGGGYQDNRNVQITITVNDGVDVQEMTTILDDALGTNRFGTFPRRY